MEHHSGDCSRSARPAAPINFFSCDSIVGGTPGHMGHFARYDPRVNLRKELYIPFWYLPNVLALDAPLLAMLWQTEFAQSISLNLKPSSILVLGISVWLVYAADRLLDGLRLIHSAPTTHRHAFFLRWRHHLIVAWVLILVLDLILAFSLLESPEIIRGCILAVLVTFYLGSVHLGPMKSRLPKEVFVAAILTGGITIFSFGVVLPVASVILFCALCFLNCAFIAKWEDQIDQAHGISSLADRLPWVWKRLPLTATLLIGACLITGLNSPQPIVEIALATFGLVGLNQTRRYINPQLRRVLADAVLLTPLLPF